MKILKLHFKNLNSLKGDFTIDFTAKEYEQSGIFLISGPTGSGKSTILDALSLALFGRTPRIKTISQKTNEVMTQGCAECLSAVEFSTLKGVFRSTFSQRRAYNKADGALQKIEMELANAQTNEIIATKINEIADKIEDLSGMNYERFTKSILIAQGEFSKFLHAKSSERSALLEQITGSEIYSEISKLVQKLTSEKMRKLTLLNEIVDNQKVLSLDEENSKEKSLVELNEKVTKLNLSLKDYETKLYEKQNLEKLIERKSKLELKKNELLKEKELFASNELSLTLDKKAQIIRPIYVKYENFLKQDKNLKTDLNKSLLKTPKINLALQNAIKVKENKEIEVQDLFNKEQDLLKLLKEVRNLDTLIAKENDDFSIINKKQKDLNKKLDDIYKNSQTLLEQKQKVLADKVSNQNKIASQKLAMDYLALNLESIKLQFKNLEKYPPRLEAQNSLIVKLKKDFKKNTKNKTLEQENLQKAQDEIAKARLEVKNIENEITSLLNGESYEFYQREINEFQNYLKFLNTIKTLSEHRAELVDNEPCPLCGSKVHPYCIDKDLPKENDTEIKLKAVKDKVENINKLRVKLETAKGELKVSCANLSTIESKLNNLTEKVNSLSEQIKSEENKLINLQIEYDGIAKSLDNGLSEHELGEYNVKTTDLIDNLTKKYNDFKALEKEQINIDEKINSIKTDEEVNKNKALNLEKEILENKATLDNALSVLKINKERRFDLFSNYDPDLKEHQMKDAVAQSRENLANAVKETQNFELLLKENQTLNTKLQAQIKNNAQELENSEQALKLSLKDQGFTLVEDFLNAILSDEKREKISSQLKVLENSLTETLGQIESLNEELKKSSEKVSSYQDKSIQELSEHINELKNQIRNLNQEYGAINQELLSNKEKKKELLDKLKERDLLQKEYRRYANLNDLIGSADGKKFRNFAQGMTFEIMIKNANEQLAKMNDRYLLVRDSLDPLSINVIDSFEANNIRTTSNLSGGESFIVSLALALGLSQMSRGKVRVDSLFLDEGFGTLDENALNTALNTLASLHQENKLIGIISHVQELNERIPVQIKVETKGGGHSNLSGPGIK